jgi:hypothetical protein
MWPVYLPTFKSLGVYKIALYSVCFLIPGNDLGLDSLVDGEGYEHFLTCW